MLPALMRRVYLHQRKRSQALCQTCEVEVEGFGAVELAGKLLLASERTGRTLFYLLDKIISSGRKPHTQCMYVSNGKPPPSTMGDEKGKTSIAPPRNVC